MDNKDKQNIKAENQQQDIDKIKREVMASLLDFKRSRNANGWTVAELSEKSGVSVGVISELENSDKRKEDKDKKVPSLVNFIALTRALGMSDEFVIDTVLNKKQCGKSPIGAKRMSIMNSLRDYGIHDEDSIRFIMSAIHFVKNRTINKKLGNNVTTK